MLAELRVVEEDLYYLPDERQVALGQTDVYITSRIMKTLQYQFSDDGQQRPTHIETLKLRLASGWEK